MRTNHLLGAPLALTGIALLVAGVSLSQAIFAPLPANVPINEVQLGAARVPVTTAILFQVVFLVVGSELSILGVIVAVFGAGRARGKRANRTSPHR